MDSDNKVNKKIDKKKIILPAVCVFIALCGVGTGFLFNKLFIGKSANYDDINSDELKSNTELLMERYNNVSDGNYEEEFTPAEIAAISFYLFESHDNYQSVTTGASTAAIVNQSIRGFAIKQNGMIAVESMSKSKLVHFAKRLIRNEDVIDYYSGDAVTDDVSEYTDNKETFALDDFKGFYGGTLEHATDYTISNKTVLNSNKTYVTKDDNGYLVSLDLDPLKAVAGYVKKMKWLSNLASYPAFDYATINLKLDKTLLVKEMNVNEKYYAKTSSGVGSNVTTTTTIKFEVDGDFVIPNINEAFDYSSYL